MKDFFSNIWTEIVKLYGMYSSFVHSILPAELGDLAEAVIDIAIACLIVKMVADIAFKTKSEEF